MNPAAGPRTSGLLALALLVPLLAWTSVTALEVLGQAEAGGGFAQRTLRTLLLVQALVIPLLLPWFVRTARWRDSLPGPLLILLVPLPLLVVLMLAGELGLSDLLLPTLLLALAIVILGACLRLLTSPLRQAAAHLVQTALSLLTSGMIWAFRDTWPQWIGL
jgi:hypothetical protein